MTSFWPLLTFAPWLLNMFKYCSDWNKTQLKKIFSILEVSKPSHYPISLFFIKSLEEMSPLAASTLHATTCNDLVFEAAPSIHWSTSLWVKNGFQFFMPYLKSLLCARPCVKLFGCGSHYWGCYLHSSPTDHIPSHLMIQVWNLDSSSPSSHIQSISKDTFDSTTKIHFEPLFLSLSPSPTAFSRPPSSLAF